MTRREILNTEAQHRSQTLLITSRHSHAARKEQTTATIKQKNIMKTHCRVHMSAPVHVHRRMNKPLDL